MNAASGGSTPTAGAYGERAPSRLGSKARDGDGAIKWAELLEKFRNTQDRSRKMLQRQQNGQRALGDGNDGSMRSMSDLGGTLGEGLALKEKALPDAPRVGGDGARPLSAQGVNALTRLPPSQAPGHKSRSSLGNFGRLTGGIGARNKAKR